MKLTKESYNKLQQELEDLELKERPAVARLLKEAIEQGDLSENAAYEQAKERQSQLEQRIHELKNILGSAEIITAEAGGIAKIGSRLKVRAEDGVEREFTITDISDANPAQGKISYDSPLGEAFLGHKIDETVQVLTPSGTKNYAILNIL